MNTSSEELGATEVDIPEKQIFAVERQSPPTARIPGDEVVTAKGQAWEIEGAFTKDQVGEMVREHGGKGIFSVSARSSRTGKVVQPAWLIKVDVGEVNVPYLLADMYPAKARELVRAGLISPDGALQSIAETVSPSFGFTRGDDDPDPEPETDPEPIIAEDINTPEAQQLRKELAELHAAEGVELLRKTVAERRRQVHQKQLERKDVEEEVAGEISDRRPPRRHREVDEDRPLTRAELRMERLEQQLATIATQMAAKPQAQENGGGLKDIVMMMIESNKSNAEVMKEVSKSSAANESKNRELMMDIMKSSMERSAAMVNQGDKQFELMIKMLDRKDDQKSSELAHMIKLMEFGANMRESGSAEGVPWWQELLGGLGQLGGVVADKLGGGPGAVTQGGSALPARLNPALAGRPPARPALPNIQQPAPAQEPLPGAVHFDPNQMASAEAVVLPAQAVAPAPAVEAQEAQGGEETVATNVDLRDTVEAVLASIEAQRATKPVSAEWVEIAYQDLPYEIIKKVATTENPRELLPLVEPYIGVATKIKIGAALQTDKLLAPWLTASWEEFQGMCREKVAEMEPATAAPQADNVEEGRE